MLKKGSLAEGMLRRLVRCSRNRMEPLFQLGSYAVLHKYVCKFKVARNLAIDITPHSLRAGGATQQKLEGDLIDVIQFDGRWESQATCKGYVDVVFAILPETLAEEDKCQDFPDSEFL